MDFGAAEFLANCIDRLPWGVDQKATRHMLFQVYPCLYKTTLTLIFDIRFTGTFDGYLEIFTGQICHYFSWPG